MKTPEELREEFWETDRKFGGGDIYKQYLEIKRILAEQDLGWVKSKLAAIKEHAISNTEFYSCYSITDEFPVVNKSILIENHDACKAKGNFTEPIHISSTSGSTGTPFRVEQDSLKRKRHIADIKVFGERCDYPSHERMVCFRSCISLFHRTPEQEDRENIYYCESCDLSDTGLEVMVQILLDKRPRIVLSYASTLVELAKYVERMGIPASAFSMKSVLTMSEALPDNNRRLLERAFGCKVYRRYSNMEFGILGQDMADGSAYELNWGSYYFECLKMDEDKPAEFGEAGRIVITDLFNYAFPMIRYDTGDVGVMEQVDEAVFPRLREIYGRRLDCIYSTDGRLISCYAIENMMWNVEGIRQWQVIQDDSDLYILRLNKSGDVDLHCLEEKFKDLLGRSSKIAFEFVDEIPVLSSGKRRSIICNYKKC